MFADLQRLLKVKSITQLFFQPAGPVLLCLISFGKNATFAHDLLMPVVKMCVAVLFIFSF